MTGLVLPETNARASALNLAMSSAESACARLIVVHNYSQKKTNVIQKASVEALHLRAKERRTTSRRTGPSLHRKLQQESLDATARITGHEHFQCRCALRLPVWVRAGLRFS